MVAVSGLVLADLSGPDAAACNEFEPSSTVPLECFEERLIVFLGSRRARGSNEGGFGDVMPLVVKGFFVTPDLPERR